MTGMAGLPWQEARHAGLAMVLLLAACDGGAADPQCIAARQRFEQMWPAIANAFGLSGVSPGNTRPEIVGGFFGAAVSNIPERGVRQRCYDTTMLSFGFLSYPPFGRVTALSALHRESETTAPVSAPSARTSSSRIEKWFAPGTGSVSAALPAAVQAAA